MNRDHLAPTEEERARIRKLNRRFRHTVYINPDASLPLKLSVEEAMLLLAQLQSRADRKWKERTVAAWTIGVSELPIFQRDAAITSLRLLLRNRREFDPFLVGGRIAVAYMIPFMLLFPVGYIVTSALSTTIMCFGDASETCHAPKSLEILIDSVLLTGVFAGMASTLSLPVAISLAKFHNNEARAMAATALLRQNALEALPEILEGALGKSEAVRKECRLALYHFLPQITEANRDALMPLDSEARLGKLLGDTRSVLLCGVIVDYLEKFSQGSNIKAVEACLVSFKEHALFRTTSDIAAFIAKCERVLVLLRERQNQDHARQKLLRHSSLPTNQSDQLLRPAAESQTTPAEQLLRASSSQDD